MARGAEAPVAVEEYEALARAALGDDAWDYFAGGAGAERTLAENIAAWRRHRLRPQVLVDVDGATTATTVLGMPVAMPVLVAPMAIQRLAHPEGELALAAAAAGAGSVYVLSTAATARPGEVAAAAPDGTRWFQLDIHRDREHSRRAVEDAVSHGFSAVVLTVDTPVPGLRLRDRRNGFRIPAGLELPGIARSAPAGVGMPADEFYAINDPATTWRDLEQLVAACPVPVVVKGIQRGDDAARARECGAAAVIVSNHGGRQLDGVRPTAEVLPEVVAALGDRCEVFVDGGLRDASDVAVALALGARAVLVGRPVLWGLAAAGRVGAAHVLELFHESLLVALALLGCRSPEQLDASHIRPAWPG